MSDATVRAKYCGAAGTAVSVAAALAADALEGGRALSELACGRFTFECTRCNNLHRHCAAAQANLASSGSALSFLPLILDRAIAAKQISPAQLKLLLVALARRSPPMFFRTLARYPLTAAPLAREAVQELTHADMTIDSQLHFVAAGVCDRDAAGIFLRRIHSNQDPNIAQALRAEAVRRWALWVTQKAGTLPEPWQKMLSVALCQATPLPSELCVLVCAFFGDD
jgi:hypothetical protein